jgi:GxxExxY protein
MSELLYREETRQLIGLCMEIHRELGKGHDEINYKGVILPHLYRADFVVWGKILFEGKAVEQLVDAYVKQVLNYLAASKLRLGLLINFGGDSLEWKRVIL